MCRTKPSSLSFTFLTGTSNVEFRSKVRSHIKIKDSKVRVRRERGNGRRENVSCVSTGGGRIEKSTVNELI